MTTKQLDVWRAVLTALRYVITLGLGYLGGSADLL